ncbi:MAG: cache domain-containing protein [Polyangiales bacterium]
MRFSRDAPRALIVSIVVVVAAMTLASDRILGATTSSVEQSEIATMKSIVDSQLRDSATNALARAEMLASTVCLRNALAARDRPTLLHETQALFAEQREKYGVDQLQFHVPPATSFLRLQAPENHGDDLTRFRPMVVEVNREHVARKGVAIARSGPAIFGIAPVSDLDGHHVGSVEVGLDFGAVLDRIKAAYGLELTLFIEEEPLREFARGIRPGVLTEANRVGHVMKVHSTNWALMRRLVGAEELRVIEEPEHYTREALGVPYGVVVLPIRSTSGRELGAIVVAKDFSPTRGATGRSRVLQGLLAVFSIVLLMGVVVIVIRGFLLGPLGTIRERFARTRAGEEVPPDPEDAKLCEELAALAKEHELFAAARKGTGGAEEAP